MNDVVTTYAPAYARRPAALIDRHADALAELRQFHDEHQMLERKVRQQEQYIAKLTEQYNVVVDQLQKSREMESVAMRKLMRLAAHVQGIGMLASEATQIVRDAKEWEEHWQQQEAEAAANHETANVQAGDELPETATDGENAAGIVDQMEKLPPVWKTEN
jgi:16S rRNA G1207 methylase RsmC